MARFVKKQNNRRGAKLRKGFTMIEFSLASAFVGVLLITVSTVIMNMIEIYQKGLTVKSVNSTGRSLVDDIENSIQSSGTIFISQSNNDSTYYQKTGNYSGALCTGSYTYVWNTRAAFKDNRTVSVSGKTYRLAKVLDSNRDICRKWTSGFSVSGTPQELLADSDITLYIYSFKVSAALEDELRTQTLMTGEFQLGTDRENGVKITNCEQAEDANYCALGVFEFAARTAGKENSGQ